MGNRDWIGWPFYLLLFAAHPVLSLLFNNVNKVPVGDAILPLLAFQAVAMLIWGAMRLWVGSWRRAAPETLIVLIWLLFFQRFEANFSFLWGMATAGVASLCLWTWLLALTWWIVRHRAPDPVKFGKVANAVAVIFVVLPLAGIVWHNWQISRTQDDVVAAINQPLPQLAAGEAQGQPDIWYIVLDRYARGDVLREIYGFDNSPFLDRLRGQGFQVMDQSRANYQRTAHSLAASLNLDYLDRAAAVAGSPATDWQALYRALSDNKIWRLLKSAGYRYIHAGSWWRPTAMNPYADENIIWRYWPTFQRYLWAGTLPGRISAMVGLSFMRDRHSQCERVAYKFETLMSRAAEAGPPKFVFAHYLMPHPPFVVDTDGRCMDEAEARTRSRRDNYIAQVRYTNDQLSKLIQVIDRANRRAIIILQADEGPWPVAVAGNEHAIGRDTTAVHWDRLSKAQLTEKLAIFHAIRWPKDTIPPALAPDHSPVNTFRLILSRAFGADLPRLPDQSFIYLDNNNVFTFQPVP